MNDECIDQLVTGEERKQLEEWTGLKCKEILFNSTTDNWSQTTSVFYDRIIGKSKLVFIIEDTDGEVFGYYLNTEVISDPQESFERTDSKSFLFNLQSNGRLNGPTKFSNDAQNYSYNRYYGYKIRDYSFYDDLIILSDINLKKQNVKQFCHCSDEQICGKSSYWISNTMHGFFTPETILVIQMDYTDEEKEYQRIQEEENQKKRQMNFKLLKETNEKELKQLEEWTSLKCSEIIFDSEVDNWKKYECVLNDKIIGKRQLAFLIEEQNGELFGCYFNTVIEKNDYCICYSDEKTFLFNLKCHNGRLPHPMKFERKANKHGSITLGKTTSNLLIRFGNLVLHKEDCESDSYYSNSYTECYEHHGIENALCGKSLHYNSTIYKMEGEYIKIKRIIVIQMN